jgi:hypothetical protein
MGCGALALVVEGLSGSFMGGFFLAGACVALGFAATAFFFGFAGAAVLFFLAVGVFLAEAGFFLRSYRLLLG